MVYLGAAKENILEYIPAMVFNMYDGFYIYGPMYVPKILENNDEMASDLSLIETGDSKGDAEGDIWYVKESDTTKKTKNINDALKTKEYSLTSITPYSARYKTADGNTNIIVEYTLDNYIKISGIVDGKNFDEEGYLTYFGIDGSDTLSSELKTIGGIQYLGEDVKPEKLTETVNYKDINGNQYTEKVNYVYNIKQKKCYSNDGGMNWFYIDENSMKIAIPEDEYWKTICLYRNGVVEKYFMKLSGEIYEDNYSDLYNDNGFEVTDSSGKTSMVSVGDNTAYIDKGEGSPDGTYDTYAKDGTLDSLANTSEITGAGYEDVLYDFSAINYFIETKCFSDKIVKILGDKNLFLCKLEYDDTNNKYIYIEEEVGNIFKLGQKNNPESLNSILVKHKKEVIKDTINKSLNNVIANYNKYNLDSKHEIPMINYDDIEDALNNVSFFVFLSGMKAGYKKYNDYSFAVSNNNNDFINSKSFKYVNDNNADSYLHYIYCDKSDESEMTGYRNIELNLGMHKKDITNTECYYCIVNRGEMTRTEPVDKSTGVTKGKEDYYESAYLEAIARERYNQNENPPEVQLGTCSPLTPGIYEPPPPPTPQSSSPPSVSVPSINTYDPPSGGGDGPPLFLI